MTQSTPARPDTDTDGPASATIGDRAMERRTMLRGVAAGGAVIAGAGLLTACGSDGGGDTEASTPTPSETEPGAGGQGDGADGKGVLVPTSDVPDGGGVILTEEKVVVTQPTTGEFAAFSSTCTHQGCQVGDVSDGTINCPCHGSQYSIEDGSVVTGPATAPLPAVEVTVDGDSVVRS